MLLPHTRRSSRAACYWCAEAKVQVFLPVVAFFPVFREVEANGLHFFAGAQTYHRFHDVGDEHRARYRETERQADGLELLNPEPTVGDQFGEAVLGGWIG